MFRFRHFLPVFALSPARSLFSVQEVPVVSFTSCEPRLAVSPCAYMAHGTCTHASLAELAAQLLATVFGSVHIL